MALAELSEMHSKLINKIELLAKAVMYHLPLKIDGLTQDIKSIDDFILFLSSSLPLHHRVEEEALFPVLAKIPEARRIVDELALEHVDIMSTITRIQSVKGEYKMVIKYVRELLTKLSDHVRREEEYFPKYVSKLSEEDLKVIGSKARELGYQV